MSERTRLFAETTPRRTMGSETEYTTRLSSNLDSNIPHTLVAKYTDPNQLWLKNGARLYVDSGRVIEYATPEVSSGEQVLLQERVGEIIVRTLSDVVTRADGSDDTIQENVYKRTGYANVYPHNIAPKTVLSSDDEIDTRILNAEVSVGHHETYQTGLMESDLSKDSYSGGFLNTYLATRIVWSGTGLVTPEGYNLSQKADAIDFTKNELTIHGEKTPYRYRGDGLIEIRTGEGNMSEWAIVTKFDMTSLIFRLIEHGDIPDRLIIEDGSETAAMRIVSVDPTLPLAGEYEELSAIEIQGRIAQHALWFAEKHPEVPKHEVLAAQQVRDTCRQLLAYYRQEADLSVLSDRVDWAAKLDKMRSRGISMGEVTCKNLVAVAHDLAWEDISSSSSSRRWYRKQRLPVFSETDIKRQLGLPPSGRAGTRMKIVAHYGSQVRDIDWDKVMLTEDRYISVDKPKFE